MFKKPKPQPRPSHPSIERARKIAKLLDTSFTIPILRKKIGLDPILGLLPVGGDVVSALLAAYLVWVAIEIRLPQPIVIRMAINIIVDCFIGMIPVVGDVADAMWKSNQWNFKLLEEGYQKHGIGPDYFSKPQNLGVVDVVAEPING